MILLDLSGVMYTSLVLELSNQKLDDTLIRHVTLNKIRSLLNKFKDEYGELVIACDNRNYWRRKVFPYYKAARKKNREKSPLDWPTIFKAMDAIRQELKEYFPYRVIDVDGAEADDVIGVLCDRTFEPTLILSSDKDFIQLHNRPGVRQFDPIRKRWVQHNDPDRYKIEHILRGDAGDGIPNILSSDDCFVLGNRQSPLRTAKMEQLIENIPAAMFRNYERNRMLIDLTQIPDDIQKRIVEAYDSQAGKTRAKLFNYFIKFKLKNLSSDITDF
jgi:hypothetical protein